MSYRLILMIGLPGSGKSTLAQQLVDADPRRVIISTDAIREKLFGDAAIQGSWFLIAQELKAQLQQAIAQIDQGNVREAIYDATNVVRRQRREAIALVRSIGFTHITALWLDVPLAICQARNQKRDRQVPPEIIDRMYRRLMGGYPSIEEGLDCLVRYSFGAIDR